MKLINNPDKSQWDELLKRPVLDTENLFGTVRGILDRVRAEGDRAVGKVAEVFSCQRLYQHMFTYRLIFSDFL